MAKQKRQKQNFILYDLAMTVSKKSNHAYQLERRKLKYPKHFKTIKGVVFVSEAYVKALQLCHEAAENLRQLEGETF